MKVVKRTQTFKSSKKNFRGGFVLGSIVLQLACFLLLLIIGKYFDYSIDNYRYIYSSLLQIIGGIFAFIASSTLVAYQFLTSFSPISIQYYPKRLFVSFLVITLAIVGLDVLSIYMLQSEISSAFRYAYDFLITLNIYPLALALKYVMFVIKSITPQNQLSKLLENATKATTNKERLDVIYSLEEMCLSAIQHGQGGYVRSCQDKFEQIIEIYSQTHVELNKNSAHYPDNPLRILPNIIERISYSLVDNNMQNLLHFNGHILRELSGARYYDIKIVDVEIASAIEHIGLYCIERRKITDIKNFIANAVFCLDKTNSADTMFWGCRMLINSCTELVKLFPYETLEIIEEIFTCVDYSIENEGVYPKDGVSMIDFLCSQEWLNTYYEKNGSKTVPTIIDKLSKIRNDLYELSKNSEE